MPFPFTFWVHPITGKCRVYPGNESMCLNVGRYLVPLRRRDAF